LLVMTDCTTTLSVTTGLLEYLRESAKAKSLSIELD
jgi:hypothetical protein